MSAGSEFHRCGAAYEKARLAKVVVHAGILVTVVGLTTSVTRHSRNQVCIQL